MPTDEVETGPSLGLMLLIGAVLVTLTAVTSTLSFVLRTYSHARLVARLSPTASRGWAARLESHETQLRLFIGFMRAAAIAGLGFWAIAASAAAFGSPLAAAHWILASLISAPLLALFAIAIPNALAAHAGEAILARLLSLLWLLRLLLLPIEWLLMGGDALTRRLVQDRRGSREEQHEMLEREILSAVDEGAQIGAVGAEESEIIRSVFELGETPVSAIMTPRTDISAISLESNYQQVRDFAVHEGHSRIPVYDGTLDRVVGVLYAKDLLRVSDPASFDLAEWMRSVPFVPESKLVDELLAEFRQSKIQIAIVLDEYGGTAGLVTIEDILEELVGEIEDEYDISAPPTIRHVDDQTIDVDGRTSISEINSELSLELPEDDAYETISGFVFAVLGRVPQSGEEFVHDHLSFRILSAEPRRIHRLRIRVLRGGEAASPARPVSPSAKTA